MKSKSKFLNIKILEDPHQTQLFGDAQDLLFQYEENKENVLENLNMIIGKMGSSTKKEFLKVVLAYDNNEEYLTEIIKILVKNKVVLNELFINKDISFNIIKMILDLDKSYIEPLVKSNKNGYNSLHSAVESEQNQYNNKEERIKYLIENGVNVNSYATKITNFEDFSLSASFLEDIVHDFPNREVKIATALHLAIAEESSNENYDISKLLISYFKDPKYKFHWNICDGMGNTILRIASESLKSSELIKLILAVKDSGANIDVNIPDNKGRTALHIAVALGNDKSAKLLISAGADINKQDKLGYTPLHYALMKGSLIEDIFKKKSNLMRYSNKGQAQVMDILLVAGADVNIGAEGGKTIAHIAAALGNNEVVKLLIFSGANINEKDKLKRTPLHYAVMKEQLVKGVLGVLANEPTIVKACIENHVKVVEVLIKAGVRMNMQNIAGYTPIMIVNRDLKTNAPSITDLDRESLRIIEKILQNKELSEGKKVKGKFELAAIQSKASNLQDKRR